MYFLIQLTSTVNKRHEVHKHSRQRRVKKPPEQCTSVRILEDRALTPTLSCPERKLRDLVTIATKTFLRPHKLMTMLRSVREYYPDLTVIVADDSKEPLKITDSHVEYYAMPFGKVYPSQRGRHGHLGTRGPQGQVVPWLGLLRGWGGPSHGSRILGGRGVGTPLSPLAASKFPEKSGHSPFPAVTGWVICLSSRLVWKLMEVLVSDWRCLTL